MSDETKPEQRRVYVVTFEDGGILQSTEAFLDYDTALEYVRTQMKDENPVDWTAEADDLYPERVWSWYEYASDDGAHYVIHELEPGNPVTSPPSPPMQPSPAFVMDTSKSDEAYRGYAAADTKVFRTEPHGAYIVRELEQGIEPSFRNRIYEVSENVKDAIPVAFTGEELESLAAITAKLRGDEQKDFLRADGAAKLDEAFLRSVASFLRETADHVMDDGETAEESRVARIHGYADEIESVLEDRKGAA